MTEAINPNNCPLYITLEMIKGKWKPLILYYLGNGTYRFNHLHRLILGVSQRMLTLQLRELEEHGLINREVYDEVPPRVEYSLTDSGKSLLPILENLYDWGEQYQQQYNS